MVLRFSQKFIEIVSKCINIEKLGVAHSRRVDWRIVLQFIGLTKLLKAIFLWWAQHFLPCHSVPLISFFIVPSSYISSLYAPFNFCLSLAVTIHLCFALFLFGLRETKCISFWFGNRNRFSRRTKRKLLFRDKGAWFSLWVWLFAIVFIGIRKRFFGFFDGSNCLGGTILRLLLILLFKRIDHFGEDVAIRQKRVIHVIQIIGITAGQASWKCLI